MLSVCKPSLATLSRPALLTDGGRRGSPVLMQGFGKRLADARRMRGMKVREIAAHFGVSTSAVSQWENDQTLPDLTKAMELPRLLRVSPLWLLYNVGLPEQEGNDTIVPEVRSVGEQRVPRISPMAAAQDFRQAAANATDSVNSIGPSIHHGDFAIDVWDDSNAPEMVVGDYVFVRPGLAPRPGDFALVAVGKERVPMFGQLGRSASGGWELVHVNPLWGRRLLDLSVDKIIGVRVARVTAIRR